MRETERRPSDPGRAEATSPTVAIAHRSRIVTDGLATLLGEIAGIDVLATFDELPTFAQEDDDWPDVLILDPDMVTDTEVVTGLAHRKGAPRILLIADAGDTERNIRLLAAGAVGLVDQTAGAEAVTHAVLAAVRGLGVAPLRYIKLAADRLATAVGGTYDQLDDDERALWLDVADGLDYATIAERHFVSERTARRRVEALLDTLGVDNRLQAAELAGRVFLRDRAAAADATEAAEDA